MYIFQVVFYMVASLMLSLDSFAANFVQNIENSKDLAQHEVTVVKGSKGVLLLGYQNEDKSVPPNNSIPEWQQAYEKRRYCSYSISYNNGLN